jgi:serine/threonine-protein kinase
VGELVERPLHPEIRTERQREHESVGWYVAAAVIADQQHRALGGNPVQAPHVGPEIQRRQQPCAGQLLADVVGVALVQAPSDDVGTTFAPAATPPKRSLLRAGIIVPAILAVQLLVAVTVAVMEFRRADRPEATAPTTMSPEPVRP